MKYSTIAAKVNQAIGVYHPNVFSPLAGSGGVKVCQGNDGKLQSGDGMDVSWYPVYARIISACAAGGGVCDMDKDILLQVLSRVDTATPREELDLYEFGNLPQMRCEDGTCLKMVKSPVSVDNLAAILVKALRGKGVPTSEEGFECAKNNCLGTMPSASAGYGYKYA